MTTAPVEFTPERRAALNALADIITPGGAGYPSPAQADTDGAVLTMALTHAYPNAAALAVIADAAAGRDPAEFLHTLEQADPDGYATLRTVLVGRYLSCRTVWRLLDYHGRVPNPPSPDEADYYLRERILEPVIARGRIYLPTPDQSDAAADITDDQGRQTT